MKKAKKQTGGSANKSNQRKKQEVGGRLSDTQKRITPRPTTVPRDETATTTTVPRDDG